MRFQQELNIALKEWSATINALAQGDQIFLLRKGGLRERNRHFKVEHSRFLLYPTLYHEAEKLVKHRYRQHLDVSTSPVTRSVSLRAFATVDEVHLLDDEAVSERIAPFHIWSDDFVEKRFGWKPRHQVNLLLLRTHVLPEPVELPVLARYRGCTSWVDLDEPLDLSSATPALGDGEWDAKKDALLSALQG